MLFRAQDKYADIDLNDNSIKLTKISEINTDRGWILGKDLTYDDLIIVDDEVTSQYCKISNIIEFTDYFIINIIDN